MVITASAMPVASKSARARGKNTAQMDDVKDTKPTSTTGTVPAAVLLRANAKHTIAALTTPFTNKESMAYPPVLERELQKTAPVERRVLDSTARSAKWFLCAGKGTDSGLTSLWNRIVPAALCEYDQSYPAGPEGRVDVDQKRRIKAPGNHFDGVRTFSATMARDREMLGEKITEWIKRNPNEEIVDAVVTQSSDEAFHCLAITLFFRHAVTS